MNSILYLLWWALGVLCVIAVALVTWRQLDRKRAESTWRALAARAPRGTDLFEPAMVDGLPEPARRFFLYTIEEGTP